MLLLFFVGRQEDFQGGLVDFAIDMQTAHGTLEIIHDSLAVEDLDLGDQTIEPQPNRRVRDAVRRGQILEGSRSQDKPLQKRPILVIQQVDPFLCIRHESIVSRHK